MQTVAIVGVGLIGGSFARGLRHFGFEGEIIGVGSDRTTARAVELGVIDRAASLADACAAADLVYLSHTISRILEDIPRVAAALKPGALVTDAGSTKSEICSRAAECLPPGAFLGGHPMAGKETRGVEGADPLLFQNRTYAFTPTAPSHLDSAAARLLLAWVSKLGARVIIMSPLEHDETVAFTSHLPQVVSTALAQTVARQVTDLDRLKVAGPGLTDMTRLALSSHDLWADILATNRSSVRNAITQYILQLQELRTTLEDDPQALRSTFEEAAQLATRIRTS